MFKLEFAILLASQTVFEKSALVCVLVMFVTVLSQRW